MRRLFVALLALVTWGAAQAATLSLAVSQGPVSLLVYLAEAQGYFRLEGLDLQRRDCSSGRDCYRLLADGTVDVATAAEMVVGLNAKVRPELAIFATISASSQQIKLVARGREGGVVPTMLRGQRIGTIVGSSAEYFADSWLLFHGIDPKTVQTVDLPPDRMAEALRRGEVEAVTVWEPFASAALAEGGVALPAPRVYTQFFSLVADRRTLAGREREITQLLRALLRAQRLAETDPALAARVLQARLQLSPEAAAAQLREHDFRLRLDQALLSTMAGQRRWATRAGRTGAGERDDVALPVEPGPLRRVAPGAVTLVR